MPNPFVLRCRPPPSPTLFPYTTLFRSPDQAGDDRADRAEAEGLVDRGLGNGVGADRIPQAAIYQALRDRKSTRLNSSHRTISYAVFCLKKKSKSPDETVITYRLGPNQR